MKSVSVVLVAISDVGIIGLHWGDPCSFIGVISFEVNFTALTLISKEGKDEVIRNVTIACHVITGNTIAHVYLQNAKVDLQCSDHDRKPHAVKSYDQVND